MPISRLPKQGALIKSLLAVGVLSALSACGGGIDYKPIQSAPQTLTIKGTAAKGAAISGGAVSVVCKLGTGAATTNADGTYTVTTSDPSQAPCLITVTSGTTVLRSIAPANNAVANVTPLSEMLVAYVVKQSGLADGAAPSAIATSTAFSTIVTTPATLAASATQVVTVLKSLGVTVPADFLSATLVAASGSGQGNAQDAALDALKTAGVVTASGAPTATASAAIATDAAKHTITGATGGG